MPTAQAWVWWRGVRMDENSIPSLLMAEKKSGIRFRPVQGGYNRGGVAASAGTHDGGAVVDLSVSGLDGGDRAKIIKWMRLCGWAAWVRTPAQGFSWHIHAVRVGDVSAAWGAKAQVVAYRLRRDGLARNRRDTEAWYGFITWEDSRYNPRNAPKRPVAKQLPPYVIDHRKFKGLRSVSVFWVNANRRQFEKTGHAPISRHVHRVQVWLTAAGFPVKRTGEWGSATQRALDSFRTRKLGWKGNDRRGPIGIASLTALKRYGASTNKYGVKEGK